MHTLKLIVREVRQESPLIRSFRLEAADGGDLPAYSPGSHIKVRIPGLHDPRNYSLINTGNDTFGAPGQYRLGVRIEENSQGGSRYMHALKEGDVITAQGPANEFPLADHPGSTVLIAGGIGITPIASMAASLANKGSTYTLHYSGRSRGQLAFVDELQALAGDRLVVHADDEPATAFKLDALLDSRLLWTPSHAPVDGAWFAGLARDDSGFFSAARWSRALRGAANAIELTFEDLKAMPAVEVTAVNQCSGNRRGLVQPNVPGVQWGYGAMGCARWKGVRLRDLLAKIGVKKEAIEVVFDGADEPASPKTPDFVKSIPLWKAMEDATLVAYEMNGEPLPHFNGFPARIVVPGWTATYWMKHLVSIKAATQPESGFWMSPAYRIPVGKFPVSTVFASQETATTAPITEIMVNSLITSHADGVTLDAKAPVVIEGIAWDGGHGLRTVEISLDRGKTWRAATLGEDLGRFAFRPFSFPLPRQSKGKMIVMARATNSIGQTQTTELIQNPAGYHHNLIQAVTLHFV